METKFAVIHDADNSYEAHGEYVRSSIRKFQPCSDEREALVHFENFERDKKNPVLIEYQQLEIARETRIKR